MYRIRGYDGHYGLSVLREFDRELEALRWAEVYESEGTHVTVQRYSKRAMLWIDLDSPLPYGAYDISEG